MEKSFADIRNFLLLILIFFEIFLRRKSFEIRITFEANRLLIKS
jgi:hypothetical protein